MSGKADGKADAKAPSKRAYREYEWVTLAKPIKCPTRNVSADAFPGKDFAFFVEGGWFCIESRKNGRIVEMPFTQVAEARRHEEVPLLEPVPVETPAEVQPS